jgi:hypothetical protein
MEEPQNKAELIEAIHTGWAALEAALAEAEAAGITWAETGVDRSAQDTMGHVLFWEGRMNLWLRGAVQNADPQVPPLADDEAVDRVNDENYLAYHDRPLEEVRAAFRQTHAESLALIGALPEAALFTAGAFAWLPQHSLFQIVGGNTFGHYPEHIEAIHAGLQRAAR